MGRIHVAAIELSGLGGTVDERASRARTAIDAVPAPSARGAPELLVLPEAYFPGYAHVRAFGEGAAKEFATSIDRRVVVGFIEGSTCCTGLWEPGGGWTTYQKRFVTPRESKVWRSGTESVVVPTAIGRVGMLICADLLHVAAWEALRGRVDIVTVSAAWPEYRGRVPPLGLGWLYAESNEYRDDVLGRAARYLGVPIAFANASGPGFSGGSAVWSAQGERLDAAATVHIGAAPGRVIAATLRHPPRWSAFTRVYRWAAAGQERLASRR